jgi:colicin import membrane protein
MSSVRSPYPFFASAALHALLIVLILGFTWMTHRPPQEVPQIFELVAGEGDNFAATEAPALGVPGVKIDIPAAPEPSPVEAAPSEPEQSPVVAAASPVEPEPLPPPPVKTPPKPKPTPTDYKPLNMAKMVDRISDKRAANIEKKFKKEQQVADERAAKEAAVNAKRMTKAEFDRLNKGKTSAASKKPAGGSISAKRIDTAGIAGGVVGGSTANTTGGAGGKALSRADIELSEAYISLLIQRLKQAHQKPEGLSDLLEATVKFRLTASGAVTNVAILSSSKNSEFDQSVLAAFRRITLPPPPANLKTSDYTITFKMREED